MSTNKIYYKGNPITRKDYLPISAQKNRSPKHYLVEFPQGDSFFPQTRKKQYANLHHQSQIKDSNVMLQDSDPHFSHNNLQISDIEGALPNTIISQALRNRLKGKNHQLVRNKFYSVHEVAHQDLMGTAGNSELMQAQTPKINFHFREKKIKTEPDEQINYYKPHKEWPAHQDSIEMITQGVQTKQQEKSLRDIALINPAKQNEKKSSFEQLPSLQSYAMPKPKRNQEQIKKMWHGDSHRIRLIPIKQIRKFNPTYLSTLNPEY